MPRRELWISVNGKREISGHVEQGLNSDKRVLTTYPLKPINPQDLALGVCESTVRSWGYRLTIWADGTIRLTLPRTDTYGLILREIARAYFLAINSPNPRRQLTTEENRR